MSNEMKRDARGRLLPGYSGNPGGRKAGLEEMVRGIIDFEELVRALGDIAMGRLPPGLNSESQVKVRDRIEASKLLMDRGFGKAKQTIEVSGEIDKRGLDGIDVDALDDAALDALERSVEKALYGKVHDVTPPPVPDYPEGDEPDVAPSYPPLDPENEDEVK